MGGEIRLYFYKYNDVIFGYYEKWWVDKDPNRDRRNTNPVSTTN